MTPTQIAYFKHFLYDRGIQGIYISMYRNKRIKGSPEGDKAGNPESLEQFLQEQPHYKVLMCAFYFSPGSDFGYDYWKEMNKKWLKYLEMQEDNPNNDKVVVLKGSFAILRQNWDRHEYWKTENMEATYVRMHMEPPLKGVDLEKTLYIPRSTSADGHWVKTERKFKIGDTIKGTISGEVLKVVGIKDTYYDVSDGGVIDFDKEMYWDLSDETPYVESTVAAKEEVEEEDFEEDTTDVSFKEPETETSKSDSGEILEGFSLVETTNIHGGRRIGNKIVSVNMRNNGYRVTFDSKQSEKLRKHGYKYVKLLTKEDTGEIALLFNNRSGCSVCIKKNGNSESHNVTINSKDITEHITKFYGIKPSVDYFTLEITATIQQDLNMIFKLRYNE